jgi:hypothetical protein
MGRSIALGTLLLLGLLRPAAAESISPWLPTEVNRVIDAIAAGDRESPKPQPKEGPMRRTTVQPPLSPRNHAKVAVVG